MIIKKMILAIFFSVACIAINLSPVSLKRAPSIRGDLNFSVTSDASSASVMASSGSGSPVKSDEKIDVVMTGSYECTSIVDHLEKIAHTGFILGTTQNAAIEQALNSLNTNPRIFMSLFRLFNYFFEYHVLHTQCVRYSTRVTDPKTNTQIDRDRLEINDYYTGDHHKLTLFKEELTILLKIATRLC